MSAEDCACDPGVGVFAFGCTQHRGTLTEMAALYDSATAETARVTKERDELVQRLAALERVRGAWDRRHVKVCQQLDLARAELTSATAELGLIRRQLDNRGRDLNRVAIRAEALGRAVEYLGLARAADVARIRGLRTDLGAERAQVEQLRADYSDAADELDRMTAWQARAAREAVATHHTEGEPA